MTSLCAFPGLPILPRDRGDQSQEYSMNMSYTARCSRDTVFDPATDAWSSITMFLTRVGERRGNRDIVRTWMNPIRIGSFEFEPQEYLGQPDAARFSFTLIRELTGAETPGITRCCRVSFNFVILMSVDRHQWEWEAPQVNLVCSKDYEGCQPMVLRSYGLRGVQPCHSTQLDVKEMNAPCSWCWPWS
ncbi:hypothetical protein E5Q_05222 [Mixia osmundae IAM 14324]|uniref:Uncharacterized protein n=1 Tax=Mixia osmundae (strain CBS 9802 / IAM 14324 / JCM 22182 / KY 12970) TaxID=764103 RepID=G7E6S5_MIXOS|nr:hypothetical protein E5Q_05222 [Mixia osmundae IAM 14324]